jgi:hypothetical protein
MCYKFGKSETRKISLPMSNFFQFSASEVLDLQERLRELPNKTKEGVLVDSDSQVLSGQEVVKPLWDRCWRWTEIVLER